MHFSTFFRVPSGAIAIKSFSLSAKSLAMASTCFSLRFLSTGMPPKALKNQPVNRLNKDFFAIKRASILILITIVIFRVLQLRELCSGVLLEDYRLVRPLLHLRRN